MPAIDRKKLLHEAEKYKDQMIKFMRELIFIPGESCQEKLVIHRIALEMLKAGFDEVNMDQMGNVIGKIGDGKTQILMDAHVDTVGVGDISEWKIDPYRGKFEDGIIYGRGASDQRAALVSMIYAVLIIKKLNLFDDYTLYVVGSCQEEDCEGLCLLNIIEKEKLITPDYVVLTEATNLGVYRGHRGRLVMKVTAKGNSCHASAPERGDNAIYKILPVIEGIKKLNDTLKSDDFLGKGSIAVTKIDCQTSALCAIPAECSLFVDRRLTAGETKETALKEIQDIIHSTTDKDDITVEIMQYKATSWKGLEVEQENYFPTWTLEEDHILCNAGIEAAKLTLEETPRIDKWQFSTNGVATMGKLGIPTIGFGPANEIHAHTTEDQVSVEHILLATVFYSMFPKILVEMIQKQDNN